MNYKLIFGSLLATFALCSPMTNGAPHKCKASQNQVSVLLSSSDRSHELSESKIKLNKTVTSRDFGITLDVKTKFQTMDGFGAAITGSTCYNLMQMTPENRKKFLVQTFSEKKGYGFSYVRVAIGCSDFSLSEYTCCDKPGIENFGLTPEETDYVIPILKEILKIQPNLKIMAAPWTAPRWMKVTEPGSSTPHNEWTAGHVAPKYYQDYASYFVKWIKAFATYGIHIYAVTPQNEPLNAGNSASTLMYWDEEQAFIRDALGPQFANENIKTKIYVFDHNYNYDEMAGQNDYPLKIYEDQTAAAYITGAAYHNYGGNINELNDIHSRSNKELIFTETSIGTWNNGLDLQERLIDDMNDVALGTVNRWCKAVIVWNLMLDNNMGPNREGGCQTCYGAVDINQDNYTEMTKNSHYFLIAHMSSVVRPGAVRIGSQMSTATKGIESAAFQNTDGTYALVLSNSNQDPFNLTVNDGVRSFTYACPARSVVSFSWK